MYGPLHTDHTAHFIINVL